MRIGELAQTAQCSVETIRHHEKEAFYLNRRVAYGSNHESMKFDFTESIPRGGITAFRHAERQSGQAAAKISSSAETSDS